MSDESSDPTDRAGGDRREHRELPSATAPAGERLSRRSGFKALIGSETMQPGFVDHLEVLARRPGVYYVKRFERTVFVSQAKSAPVCAPWPDEDRAAPPAGPIFPEHDSHFGKGPEINYPTYDVGIDFRKHQDGTRRSCWEFATARSWSRGPLGRRSIIGCERHCSTTLKPSASTSTRSEKRWGCTNGNSLSSWEFGGLRSEAGKPITTNRRARFAGELSRGSVLIPACRNDEANSWLFCNKCWELMVGLC